MKASTLGVGQGFVHKFSTFKRMASKIFHGLPKSGSLTGPELIVSTSFDVNQSNNNNNSKRNSKSKIPKAVSILGAAPQKDREIVKQGWIHKKSKHFKNYHKRFMILRGDKLYCYKNQPSTYYGKQTNNGVTPTEIFDLSLHRYRIDKHDTVKVKFYLVDETLSNSRTFKAPSEVDRDDWVVATQQEVQGHRPGQGVTRDTFYGENGAVAQQKHGQAYH